MVHVIMLVALLFSLPLFNRKAPWIVISFSLLFIFIAFRYGFGNDYFSYLGIFNKIDSGSFGSNMIKNYPLYYWLNTLFNSYNSLIFATSLFYISVIFLFIVRNIPINSLHYSMGILLINPYLFLLHQSSIRQTISICLFIIAIHFSIKKQFILYSVFVIAASGFHVSAIILLPIYFMLSERKVNIRQQLIIMISLLVLLLSPLFDIIMQYVLPFLPINYSYYYSLGSENSVRSTLIFIVLFLLILFNMAKFEGKYIIYAKLSLISTILSTLAIRISMISRVAMYFDVFLIITLPKLIEKTNNKVMKYIYISLFFGIYVLRYISFFNNPLWESFHKYRSMLSY